MRHLCARVRHGVASERLALPAQIWLSDVADQLPIVTGPDLSHGRHAERLHQLQPRRRDMEGQASPSSSSVSRKEGHLDSLGRSADRARATTGSRRSSEALNAASVAVLLISADFPHLGLHPAARRSPALLERRKDEGLRIVPISASSLPLEEGRVAGRDPDAPPRRPGNRCGRRDTRSTRSLPRSPRRSTMLIGAAATLGEPRRAVGVLQVRSERVAGDGPVLLRPRGRTGGAR